MNASELAVFWDEATSAFLAGANHPTTGLRSWYESYRGKLDGRVEPDAIAEPYLGSLEHTRAVFLGLNPGRAHLEFQGRSGVFASDIRDCGSYTAWAATWPYLRAPWTDVIGPNRYHRTRLRFLRDWLGEPELDQDAMTSFELYPWHSTRLNAALRPDPGIIREFVWEPIASLGPVPIFAFGAPWFRLLNAMEIRTIDRLGSGGRPYGSEVPSRSVILGESPSGSIVIAEKHLGSAGPPSSTETALLLSAVEARRRDARRRLR